MGNFSCPPRHCAEQNGAGNVIQLFPGLRKPSGLQPARPRVSNQKTASGLNQLQTAWLSRGLNRDGGHLPLFDRLGQLIDRRTVNTCIRRGWAEPSFARPERPGWVVCKLTEKGRTLVSGNGATVIGAR